VLESGSLLHSRSGREWLSATFTHEREGALYGEPIPEIRTLRALEGKGRVCSKCGMKMAVVKTINVSGKGRSNGRRTDQR
jgi:hypothetical protein